MFWLFCLLTIAVIGELLAGYRPLWRIRKLLAWLSIASGLPAYIILFGVYPSFVSVSLVVVGVYSLFNMWRVVAMRPDMDLRQTMPPINRTAVWLAAAKVIAACSVAVSWYGQWSASYFVSGLAIIQFVVALIVAGSVQRNLRTTQTVLTPPSPLADKQLPTVTIAVPARNDDGQLEACLQSLLASKYPKLEILALDNTQSGRSDEAVRRLAHAGVRFVSLPTSGQSLSSSWTIKNRDYAALADAANGDIIVFCGSDIRLAPDSIRHLLALMTHKRKQMLAIVPQNTVARHLPLVQAMRYFWELAPPRRLFRRPPVLSSCWVIDRRSLYMAGGFQAVAKSMTPEAHFAHYVMAVSDGYSFVRSNADLGITSEKSVASQHRSAVTGRYLQLHRRPEMVMMLLLFEVLLLIGPVIVAASWLLGFVPVVFAIIAAASLLLNITAFGRIQLAIFTRTGIISVCGSFIGAIFCDAYYLNRSMYEYEFGSAQIRHVDSKS